jgi:hypothetical protein
MSSQQWRWSPERLVERITLRLSTRDRLRLLEIAERRGCGEVALAREALLEGIRSLERTDPLA